MPNEQVELIEALRKNVKSGGTPLDEPKSGAEEKPKPDPKPEETPKPEDQEESVETELEEEKVEEEEEEQEVDRYQELADENLDLRQRLANLEARLQQQQPREEETNQQPAKPEDIEIEDVFTGDELQDMYDDPGSFARLLNEGIKRVAKQVYANSVEKASVRATQDVYRNLDGRIRANLDVKTEVDNFYQRNPDFVPVKDFVTTTMQNIAQNNPNAPLPELLEKTEEEVRKALRIPNKRLSGEKPSGQPPRNRQTRQSDKPQLSPVQEAIQQMRQHHRR